MKIEKLLLLCASFAAGGLPTAPGHAQTSPSKPMKIVVPCVPGKTSGLLAYILAKKCPKVSVNRC